MAKIVAYWKLLALACLLLGSGPLGHSAFAQTDQEIINQALQAEGVKNWSSAERLYLQFLQRHPGRADVWDRLGDIYSVQQKNQEAAEAFGKAADAARGDARLQSKAGIAYATISRPDRAVEYYSRATALDGSNPDYWNAKSINEAWLGRYADSEASLQNAFRAGLPRSAENLGRLATLQQWQDKTEASQRTLDELGRVAPDSPESLLSTSRHYSWQGNYYKALKFLERYKANGGSNLIYAQEKAVILAWSDKPEESLETSRTALADAPSDRNLMISQVIALNRAQKYDEAFAVLEDLEAISQPGDPELLDLRRRFEAPLRSSLSISTGFSTDRDNIDIAGGEMVYSQALDRGTFLRLGGSAQRAKADPFSGLDRIDNNDGIMVSKFWGELETLLSPNVLASVKVGGSFTNFNSNILKVGAKLSMRASDDFWVNFGYDRDHFLISPRALSFGVVRNEEYVEFLWVPDSRYYITGRFTLAQHNDTNRQKRGDLTIIRAISKKGNLSVSAGFNAVWFGYRFQLNNGYYAPNFYQRYLFPLYFTIKISDDDNVVLTFAPGMQKDDTFNSFRFAGVGTLETTHGLFKDWMLKTRWSVYVGGSESALNLAVPVGDYWIVAGNITLVKRF